MLGIVKRHLPGKGQVRALMVTEKQYATMQILLGKPTIAEKETGCHEMLVLSGIMGYNEFTVLARCWL